ncbi:DNA repair protein [Aspergillus heteromorphus CBS 117.55]|uniref:DNA repair protein RAD14 n=1 Tax=Aspergillus heteromorphus CBS 117.55 TaxID=1448321 RepID=A0A317VID0_9EURO|nr:DNA repair protein [Aspergillus heteromorphus CBS 117.55]PWY72971.1 DNA repair protein [Aspergillus heteromorphus CBS 117.55]
MESDNPSTTTGSPDQPPRAPLTTEQLQRIEANRLKAKAIRAQREAEHAATLTSSTSTSTYTSTQPPTGTKRSHTTMTSSSSPSSSSITPSTLRNPTPTTNTNPATNPTARPLETLRPSRTFTKFVEYDFSKITDTKGGFLTAEDDRSNTALHASSSTTTSTNPAHQKPAHLTQKEWERQRLLASLRRDRAGPFEPGLSVLEDKSRQKCCRECGSLEIDWKWEEMLRCCVCFACKEKFAERYSLLTKTEAREDYLLTNSELQDEDLLPHLERPNPHKSTWNNMMLYLRYQVEEYAFSDKKWGSPEALDEEFERRENEKKRRREAKFKTKLQDLKKRTRVDAYRRSRGAAGAGGSFGDDLGNGGRHVHQWGRSVEDPKTGIGVKKCVDCGMEVEELEF